MSVGVANAEGRSPALEALAAGHVGAFHALVGVRGGRPTPQVLANLLGGRAGKLSAAALEAVTGLPDGPVLLRAVGPSLLRRLARRNEAAFVKAVLRHLQRARAPLQALRPACRGGCYKAVAEADSHTVLATLRAVLGVQALAELAASTNQAGQLPWQLSVSA